MIDINGFKMKSELKELTIEELENISLILNDNNLDTIEKYIDVFSYLGVSDELMSTIEMNYFFDIISKLVKSKIPNKLTKTIEIEGKTYVAYEGDKFNLKIKDIAIIEKGVKSNTQIYSLIIAVIFKEKGLNIEDNYNPGHIKYKQELFKTLKVDKYYPYIIHVAQKLNKKITAINGFKSS